MENMDINQMKIQNILNLCYRITQETDVDVFFEYSPHIEAIQIEIHKNGWTSGTGADISFKAYTSEEKNGSEFWTNLKDVKTLDETIKFLERIEEELHNVNIFDVGDIVHIINENYEDYGKNGIVLDVVGNMVKVQIHYTEIKEVIVWVYDIEPGLNPKFVEDVKRVLERLNNSI